MSGPVDRSTLDHSADELLAEVDADDYYAIVPEWVLFHPDLSHGAVRLYGVLRRFADHRGIAFPGLSAIGQKYGVVPRSVTRHMDELIAAGAVTKKRRIGSRGSVTSNLYRVHSRPTFIQVEHAYTPDTSAALKKRAETRGEEQAEVSDSTPSKPSDTSVRRGTDTSVRRGTDKNVRLTTATTNHSQDEPQPARGKRSVVVSPPVTRERTNRTTPGQKLDQAGVAPRDRGRFKEFLRAVKGARSADAVIAAADLDDLADQVREWRASLNVQAEPDAEPILCDHGHDVSLGEHMCPRCDPARRSPAERERDVEPDLAEARIPDWLRDAIEADPALGVPGALLAPATAAGR